MFFISLLMIFGQMSSQGPALSEGATKVYIWGEVGAPGMYAMTSGLDLLELLSMAGGPTRSADLTRIKIIRGVRGEEFKFNLKRAIVKGELFLLMPGDVVVVPVAFWTSFWSKVMTGSQVITTLAVYVTLYFSIKNSFR